ncbi:MAG: M23 family metallopeptidase [Gammaproteobacteria bacterium]|nr:M23 family metallopeptidase [Gammaproteobacteria bacterium]HXK55798.1 M23 family metallopeptidase [Gammaproteobacteria bacterium]
MKVNFQSKSRKFPSRLSFSRQLLVTAPVVALLTGGSLLGGYRLGIEAGASTPFDETGVLRFHQEIDRQRKDLEEARLQARAHLDAIALRLGDMQADLLRIEALGEQLVRVGELDPEEFNFEEPPPRGGLDPSPDAVSLELPELQSEIDLFSRSIADRTHKMELIQGLFINGRIQQEIEPAGRPVEKGWISSNYGYRKDPFNGRKTFHQGVDIASKRGSPVHAVASGVVMEARKKSGYGYYIEINHADGLVTKYAHNSKVFVESGDLVEKGDIIGLVGSSGRSTGPHVHFEISRNGKSINPSSYLE